MSLPIRAYLYIRFSSAKQAEGDSLRRQEALARAYALRNGLELDEALTYRDLGVSAYDRSNVETGALAGFLSAVRRGEVPKGAYLLIEQLDRFSRADVGVAFMLFQSLIEAGIVVVTLDPEHEYKKGQSLGDLMIALVSFHRAHEESHGKSKRLRSAWGAKRERRDAVFTSECPQWLRPRADRSGYDVIEERAESIRKVYDATIVGFGNVAIVRRANSEGWPAPSKSGSWHTSLVGRILKNRAVLGEFHPNAKNDDGKTLHTGDVWYDYYPRIISDDVFHLATATREGRSQMPRRRDEGYRNIFQGLLCCGTCGSSFIRKNKASVKQEGYAIYMCADRVRGRTICPSENAANLEQRLLMRIYADAYEHVSTQDDLKRLQDAIALLRLRLSEAQTTVSRIADAIAQTDSPTLIARLPAAEKAVQDIESELHVAELELASYQASLSDKDYLMRTTFISDFERLQKPEQLQFRAELREKLLRLVECALAFPEYQAVVVKYRHKAELAFAPLGPLYDKSAMPELVRHIESEGFLNVERLKRRRIVKQ